MQEYVTPQEGLYVCAGDVAESSIEQLGKDGGKNAVDDHSAVISTGAKADISIGVVVGILLILVGVFVVWRRARRKHIQ